MFGWLGWTRPHTGATRFESSPQIPRINPAPRCTPGCCLLLPHHHELLSRAVQQCQKCEQSPPDTAMTHLAAATTPATPSGRTATHRTTRKPFSFPGDFGLLSLLLPGRRCQTKQDSLSSIYFHLLQPLKKTTPMKFSINKESQSQSFEVPRMRWGPITLWQLLSSTVSKMMEGVSAHPR